MPRDRFLARCWVAGLTVGIKADLGGVSGQIPLALQESEWVLVTTRANLRSDN